jgi:integrative and conjugative element protein (TIGR02256 family)
MPPSPKNKSGRTWLLRDLTAAQKFTDNAYSESRGTFTYVGEWHTHPEELPYPSERDKEMFEDILNGSKRPLDFLFGLILGQTGKLCFWFQDRNGVIQVSYPALPEGCEPEPPPKNKNWWKRLKR